MSRTGWGAGHGPSARRHRRRPEAESIKPQIKRYAAWRVQDAKARFNEVIRRARAEGPQRVTLHGEDAVVVIAVEDLNRLLPEEQPRQFFCVSGPLGL